MPVQPGVLEKEHPNAVCHRQASLVVILGTADIFAQTFLQITIQLDAFIKISLLQ